MDTNPSSPAKRRVLIVDAKADEAESLAMLLGTLGHDVRTARDGAAALEQARRFNPQVVFTDHDQTKRDGYTLARRLRQLPGLEGVVVIAVMGYGGELEDLLRARQAGYELLAMPFDPSQLLRSLDATAGPSAG